MNNALPVSIVARLLDESVDAAMIVDAHSCIRYINPAMQTLSGYAPAELLGQDLAGLLPPNLAGHHAQYVERYLASSGPSKVLGQLREFAIRHRTGEMIPVDMKAIDLGMDHGDRYFGAVLVDARPRRALEARHAALLTRLEQQALVDVLTGLPNRRAFDTEADSAMARARRSGGPITVGIADLDHFKAVNDQFGHAAGDVVLATVSKIIRKAARTTDFVGRVGGEEFGLLLPNATVEQARSIAERIRQSVAACEIAIADGHLIRITISIGLAPLAANGAIDEALARADAALYAAKSMGRNCVAIT